MINFLLYLDCLLLEKLMTNNSKCYKRPVAIRRANLSPNDQKFDLAYVLKHLRAPPPCQVNLLNLLYRHHLRKLPSWEGDGKDMTLFWRIKRGHLKPSDSFYMNEVNP